jgi:hypothetical protein
MLGNLRQNLCLAWTCLTLLVLYTYYIREASLWVKDMGGKKNSYLHNIYKTRLPY